MTDLDGMSADVREEKLKQLLDIFPEANSEGKVDFEKLKVILGESVDMSERYELTWKGKSNCFAAIQEKTVKTLHPAKDDSVEWDTTKNLFIEGDNLDALKILHRSYYGKIKMIYIDPPYNTGNDFIYNDKFAENRDDYEQDAGIKDENGNLNRTDGLKKNSKDGGHYHSNWLNMMYPRLYLARNLLRDDGVMFVSIDDYEYENVSKILNEIFGEDNHVETLVWKRRATPPNDRIIGRNHEYVLVFARSIENLKLYLQERSAELNSRYANPDDDPNGSWAASDLSANGKGGRLTASTVYPILNPANQQEYLPPNGKGWLYSRQKMQEFIDEGRVAFRENGKPFLKRYLSEVRDGSTLPTILDKAGFSQDSAKDIKTLFQDNVFDFPKPVSYIKTLLRTGSSSDDIVLDFFSGSGTTAHAVMQLNAEDGGSRRWISVQLPEQTDEKSEAYKAGYATIAEVAKERIRRASKIIAGDFKDELAKREEPLDLGFKVYKVGDSNFKVWNELVEDEDQLRQQMLEQLDPLVAGATDEEILTEILLKKGVTVVEDIEKLDDYYFVPAKKMAISLSRHITQELFDEMQTKNPTQIILLDIGLQDNLNLKTNLFLQAEQKDIKLEVV